MCACGNDGEEKSVNNLSKPDTLKDRNVKGSLLDAATYLGSREVNKK